MAARLGVRVGAAAVIDGVEAARMRVGCGSAAIGMFARQWHGHVDEVIVDDDHITGMLTEHQAGRFLGMAPPASACAAASRRRGATSRSPSRGRGGAVRTSATR